MGQIVSYLLRPNSDLKVYSGCLFLWLYTYISKYWPPKWHSLVLFCQHQWQEVLDQYEKNLGLSRPLVGMHVRWGATIKTTQTFIKCQENGQNRHRSVVRQSLAHCQIHKSSPSMVEVFLTNILERILRSVLLKTNNKGRSEVHLKYLSLLCNNKVI